jgi:PAS domain S-box-containing protein
LRQDPNLAPTHDHPWLTGEVGLALAEGDAFLDVLGPAQSWPDVLRNAASTILGSGFPMFLVWGPARTLLYNDPYIAILGEKHPLALGRGFWDVWPEVRPQIEPVIDAAFAGRSSFFEDLEVSLARADGLSRAWFTFSYSPIRDGAGAVDGVLCVCVETTGAVRERLARQAEHGRLEFLAALAAATSQVSGADEVLAITTRMMVEHLGLSDCAYADMDEDENGFTIRGDFAAPGSPSIVGHYSLADFGVLAVEKLSAAQPLIINNNLEEIAPDEAATFQAIGITATICMPLVKNGRLTALMAIHDNKPRHWTPAELDLLREVTARSWDSVQRAGAADALRDNEEQLRLVVEAAEVGIWDLDVVEDRLFWPPRVKTMFGISDDAEISMDDYYNGLHPEDREATLAAFAAALDPRRRAVYDVEYRTIGKEDRVVRWVAAKGRAIFDQDRCVRVLGTAIDVTTRKREQAQLLELNETLEQRVATALAERQVLADVVESTDAFIQVVDQDYCFLAVNRASADEFERIFGVRPGVGDSMLDLLAHRPDHQAAVRAVWARALAGEAFTAIDEFGDPNLDRRYYEMKFDVLRDRLGQPIGAFQFVYDVTERLRGQARVAEAEAQLLQAQKIEAIGQLTGGVAHDFNNILMVISGGLGLIERPGDPARRQRMIEGMRQAAERGASLSRQLLAFSRRQPLTGEPVDLRLQIDGMQELLDRSLAGDVHVVTDLAPDLWPVLVDPAELELVLLNLCVNARDAMPDGGVITIRATNLAADHGQTDFVRLAVVDQGVGMSAEVQARVFEPFFTTKEIGKGSGLGLAQVYGFAQQSGGGVEIDSALGGGTTVTLRLPRSRQAPAGLATPPLKGPAAQRATAAQSVLLVEDDDAVAALVSEMLRELDYRVTRVDGSHSALAAVEGGSAIDLVLSDIMMPGSLNGVDLARELRRRRPLLPILLSSGHAEPAIEAAAKQAITVLRKPYDIATLAKALREVLAQSDA